MSALSVSCLSLHVQEHRRKEEFLANMATREKKFHSIIDLENVNGDDAEGNVKRKAGSKGLPPELLTAISKLPKKSL